MDNNNDCTLLVSKTEADLLLDALNSDVSLNKVLGVSVGYKGHLDTTLYC